MIPRCHKGVPFESRLFILLSLFILLWHREDAPEAFPSQTPPAPKILKAEKKSKTQETPAPAARQREAGGGAERDRQQERTAPAKMSDHCREVPEERSGSDTEQRQQGGIHSNYYTVFHPYITGLRYIQNMSLIG